MYKDNKIDQQIYEQWEKSNSFLPKGSGKSFTIVMPPPNITGYLHIGHALDTIMQDVLIRYKRMKNYNTMLLVGMDHAGIATQILVEKHLVSLGKDIATMTKEDLMSAVLEWKTEKQQFVSSQLKKLGISCDWSNFRFTMDEGFDLAVRHAFNELYKSGLIYKDKVLVNWDSKLQTAISDLEVISKVQKGHLYYIAYSLVSDKDQHLIVATTRPETILGDTALAVNPDDTRYQKFIGKKVINPFNQDHLAVIADSYVDKDFGTGVLKITPAHDFNDFTVGKRHNLKIINILDKKGILNENVPIKYRGLSCEQARKAIVKDGNDLGVIVKIKEHEHSVPYAERTDVRIEPRLMEEQWFVDAPNLAKKAIDQVETKRIKILPISVQNMYFDWLKNIKPWNISRQLWWGHRIPAWYGHDGHMFVALNKQEAQKEANKYYGKETLITQDKDVLDTWFSSSLWPFGVMGWPLDTDKLKKFYPTDILVTGFDIIFFWVARMIMVAGFFMDKVPFHTVLTHALIRDAKGQKMSKSKGNVIDPIDIIDKYGADVLRMTLVSMVTPARDLKLSDKNLQIYRNFITKMTNIANYCLTNTNAEQLNLHDWSFNINDIKSKFNTYIIDKLVDTIENLEQNLKELRYDHAVLTIYVFIKDVYADFYLEFSKVLLRNERYAQETRNTLLYSFKQILKILHPFVPFFSEKYWQKFSFSNSLLIVENWPEIKSKTSNKIIHDVEHFMSFIKQVRAIRNLLEIGAKTQLRVSVDSQYNFTKEEENILSFMVKVKIDSELKIGLNLIIAQIPVIIYVDHNINLPKIKTSFKRKINDIESQQKSLSARLNNNNFMSKASKSSIAKAKEDFNNLQQQHDTYQKILTSINDFEK